MSATLTSVFLSSLFSPYCLFSQIIVSVSFLASGAVCKTRNPTVFFNTRRPAVGQVVLVVCLGRVGRRVRYTRISSPVDLQFTVSENIQVQGRNRGNQQNNKIAMEAITTQDKHRPYQDGSVFTQNSMRTKKPSLSHGQRRNVHTANNKGNKCATTASFTEASSTLKAVPMLPNKLALLP